MRLHVNGHTMIVGHLGPSYVIVDDPIDHPPADAELTVSIDGEARRWPLCLPDGASSSRRCIRLARRQ
jgi:hypothetical protein